MMGRDSLRAGTMPSEAGLWEGTHAVLQGEAAITAYETALADIRRCFQSGYVV